VAEVREVMDAAQAAEYLGITSRALARHPSTVSPSVTQPGRAGTMTVNPPSP